jgi:hypothetical protein
LDSSEKGFYSSSWRINNDLLDGDVMPSRLKHWLSSPAQPETELLLCCARVLVDAETSRDIEKIVSGRVDWEKFHELSVAHRVVPLVHKTLENCCPGAVPPPVRDNLGKAVDGFREHNKNNLRVLLEILSMFEENEIPVVPFKGVTTALSVYGSMDLRQCGDIDLLVDRQDYLRAKDLLIRYGYNHMYFGHAEVSTAQAQLGATDGRPSVDLHYSVSPLFLHTDLHDACKGSLLDNRSRNQLVTTSTYWFYAFDSDRLWNSLSEMDISGQMVRVLSPEDSLLLACTHGIKENWRMLRRLCDVAEIIRRYDDMDWEALLTCTEMSVAKTKICLALTCAHQHLGAPLPEQILEHVTGSSKLMWFSRRYRSINYSWGVWKTDRGEGWHAANLLTMDTLKDSFRYLTYVYRSSAPDDQLRLGLPTFGRYLIVLIRELFWILSYKLGYSRDK